MRHRRGHSQLRWWRTASAMAEATVERVAPLDRAVAGASDLSRRTLRYRSGFAGRRASVVLISRSWRDLPGGVGSRSLCQAAGGDASPAPALFIAGGRDPGHSTRPAHRTRSDARDGCVRSGRTSWWARAPCSGIACAAGRTRRRGRRVSVGDDSHLFPHVTAYAFTDDRRRVVLHAGAQVGSDGFGFVFADGRTRRSRTSGVA
jgi:UDP-3-O-[3-hydroxymyristoyl] glucosamine N-acyltransferase